MLAFDDQAILSLFRTKDKFVGSGHHIEIAI